MSNLVVLRRRDALREKVREWKQQGFSVGLVPTMGALHEGHLSLVAKALQETDRVVATLFINPKQFNSAADLAAYPRTEDDDAAMLKAAGAHCLYVPDGDQIYPPGFATNISVSGVSEGLCGAFRPGHFDGVATIVAKLFLQSEADKAFFGEKDFQQLQVVRRMAQDLDIAVQIFGCPTVREADGLAMSSRNRRLSAKERAMAAVLPETLFAASNAIEAGESIPAVLHAARDKILAGGFKSVEYLELRDAATLTPITDELVRPARLLVAGFLGAVRLIDNVQVTPN
ncbi:pantoate--beta-alanine ligase [Aureimonas fodinaquatilis]|uniref:Pantothenate synthetase n=1 Tax=Aureimonas fodinaquatilis TaxID=2565783 RepID=A0A5B0DUG6_9HYPH|nr:pantoate--beta-alanine ligase [Aureimonas fodinaquatilis]KAA0969421.1 pantoate--beta-alanine ligase [Aureimonas fodinaquatilis]